MQTREWTFDDEHDREAWGHGPWDGEPDKVQFADPLTGLPCLARRNRLGAWCGYVGVDETHPLYGADLHVPDVEVHGGITFAEPCADGEPERGICHVPDPGEPDHVWWFGFDCAHSFDYVPSLCRTYADAPGIDPGVERYWTLALVRAECAALARQLVTS